MNMGLAASLCFNVCVFERSDVKAGVKGGLGRAKPEQELVAAFVCVLCVCVAVRSCAVLHVVHVVCTCVFLHGPRPKQYCCSAPG